MGERIDKALEEYLLATYEEEPFPNEWSEQDLYEQFRKLILKDSYIELLSETSRLKEIIECTRRIVDKGFHASSEDEIF